MEGNINTLQSLTGKYRGLQGNPYNENRDPAMRTGFPVMKKGFSLWELTYREFPVSLTGFGFAVYPYLCINYSLSPILGYKDCLHFLNQ